MKRMIVKGTIAAVCAVLACGAQARVYRAGLHQIKYGATANQESDLGVDFSAVSVDASDWTLGPLMAASLANNRTDPNSPVVNPVSGRSWVWNSEYTTFGYEGEIHLTAGTTYSFGGAYDDGSAIVVDGTKVFSQGNGSGYGNVLSPGTFTATRTGWHPLRLFVWDWTGGKETQGGCFSALEWSASASATKDNYGDKGVWSEFADPGDASFLRTVVAETYVLVNYAIRSADGSSCKVSLTSLAPVEVTAKVRLGSASASADDDASWSVKGAAFTLAAGATVTVDVPCVEGCTACSVALTGTDPSLDPGTFWENTDPAMITVYSASDAVTVNEIMASNGDTLLTAGGKDGLDWVELRNPGNTTINLAGWLMTDDPSEDVSEWKPILGNAVIPAGGYLVVFADTSYSKWTSADAHVAFAFSDSGEAVAIARPDGTVVDSFTFDKQMKDASYGRLNTSETLFARTDAAQYRVGSGEWKPCSGGVGMAGENVGGFTIDAYQFRNPVNAISDGEEMLDDPTKISKHVTVKNPVFCYGSRKCPEFTYWAEINLPTDYGGAADGSGDNPFATVFPLEDLERNFVMFGRTSVTIPTTGKWTFACGSIGDAFRLRLTRLGKTLTFEKNCMAAQHFYEYFHTFDLEAGIYQLEFAYVNPNWHKCVSLGVASGEYTQFDPNAFKLVGAEGSPVQHSAKLGACVSTDVAGEMLGVSDTLTMKGMFNLDAAPTAGDLFELKLNASDNFTVQVNGETVAAYAGGARAAEEVIAPETYPIPASMLKAGENVFEITVTNDAVSDPELALMAEVFRTRVADASAFAFFDAPTPGAVNASVGKTAITPKVSFSVPHGYKTEPFQLELICNREKYPEAEIRYTLDGTSPTMASPKYEGPITISKTTCIRAAVVDENSIFQRDATATYLFLADVLTQKQGEVPTGFIASGVRPTRCHDTNVWGQWVDYTQQMRYGFREDLVNADRARIERGFTNSIATISLVLDTDLLFNDENGIYIYPDGDGQDWEAKTFVEQIDPVNGEANEFSSVAGLRLRGAGSRSTSLAKHSFRLTFRSKYGENKLAFPLFGDEGAEEFNKIDLRCTQNHGWANGGASRAETFINDVFSRDSQGAMGQPYTRSRYYNLFINGQYWGLYQTEERVDADFGEAYCGGKAKNYDVIRLAQPNYMLCAMDGTWTAYGALWNMAVNQGFASNANYYRAMGLNADGTRNEEYPIYLNPTNVMVYMLSTHYVVDTDGPVMEDGSSPNNINAVRSTKDDVDVPGFVFMRHDAEHSLGIRRVDTVNGSGHGGVEEDTTGWGLDGSEYKFQPAILHWKLCENAEYKMAFADQFYRHCLKKGGALTAAESKARFQRRMAEIDDAIQCEAARWATAGQTREDWLYACGTCLDFIDARLDYMIPQYRNRGWYPNLDAPRLTANEEQLGEKFTAQNGTRITLTGSGMIYYTTDGSDPRLVGGEVNSAASVATGSVELTVDGTKQIRARAYSEGVWSALEFADVNGVSAIDGDVASYLRFAEIYGNTSAADGDEGEYIVLTNLSTTTELSLADVRIVIVKSADAFSDAKCDFRIASGVTLAPGASVKLLRSDYLESGWSKITNNSIKLYIFNKDGSTVVQTSSVTQKDFPSAYGGGASLIAQAFGSETDAKAWVASDYSEEPEEPAEPEAPPAGSITASGYEGSYDGGSHSITVTVASGFTVEYGSSSEGPWSGTNPTCSDVGEYTVWYRVTSQDYATVTGSQSVKITRVTNSWITQPAINGWTEGETASAPVGAAAFGTVSVTYSGTTAGGATVTDESSVNAAGSYTAHFVVAETDNWTGLSSDVDFTVASGSGENPSEPEEPEQPDATPGWTVGSYTPKDWQVAADNLLQTNGVSVTDNTVLYTEQGKDLSTSASVWTDGLVPSGNIDQCDFTMVKGNNGGSVKWTFPRTVVRLDSVRVFSRWCDAGRDGIYITKVAFHGTNDTWQTIDTVCDYCRGGSNPNFDGTGALYAFLTRKDGSPLAEGVYELEITFGADQDNKGTGYAEIEAIGVMAPEQETPVDPEVDPETPSDIPEFRYYRFLVERTRDDVTMMSQVSEVGLYLNGTRLETEKLTTIFDGDTKTRPEGLFANRTFPETEEPWNAFDGKTDTKWLDYRCSTNETPEVRSAAWAGVDFGAPQKVDGYNWYTANDSVERDPADWRLQGSNDKSTWVDLDVVSGFQATGDRFALAYEHGLKMQPPIDPEDDPDAPDPSGDSRITVVPNYSGDEIVSFTVTPTGFESGDAVRLAAFYGATDCGDDLAAWDAHEDLAPAVSGQAVTFPVPAGWGSTVTAIRFAVGETPYRTELESISATSSDNGSCLDLGFMPTATMRSQLKFKYANQGGGVFYGIELPSGSGFGEWGSYRFFWGGDGETYFNLPSDQGSNYGNRMHKPFLTSATDVYEIELGVTAAENPGTGNYGTMYMANLVTGAVKTETVTMSYANIFGGEFKAEWPAGTWWTWNYTMHALRGDDYGTIYYIKVYDEVDGKDALTHDFVPVVAWNGDINLYDRVTGEFATKIGGRVYTSGGEVDDSSPVQLMAGAAVSSVTTVEGGATPEKPVVSAITVGDATVTVTISNAKAGLYYGLLSASTLEGLKTAEPAWQTEPAASEGTFDIPAGDRGTSGFFRVVVKDQP